MNKVILTGRITKDLEVKYTASQVAVCSFNLAIDRYTKPGEEKKADFPRITVYGKQAENLEKYQGKGSMIAVEGRIQTGSYKDKEGKDVYTTDIITDRVEYLSSKNSGSKPAEATVSSNTYNDPVPTGFEQVEADIPF